MIAGCHMWASVRLVNGAIVVKNMAIEAATQRAQLIQLQQIAAQAVIPIAMPDAKHRA